MIPIAITGATGKLGRLVINRLKSKLPTADILALARTTAKAAELGVPVRECDYREVESLDTALNGVKTLLLISSSEVGQRIFEHRNVIEAANKSGVEWILYTSLLHANDSAIKLLAEEHLATESDLKASGIPFTILRNGWYTENYIASVPAAIAGGAFIGCAGDGKISSAARVDYPRFIFQAGSDTARSVQASRSSSDSAVNSVCPSSKAQFVSALSFSSGLRISMTA